MLPRRLVLQLKLSAAVALRPALRSLLAALLMIPLTAFILLVLGDDQQVDWSASAAVGGVLGSIWFLAVFLSTLADLRKQDGISAASKRSFPAQSFYSSLYGLCVIGSAWLILALHREKDPVWMQLLPLVFVALAFFGWPRTITCTETTVSQRTLLGWKKRIPYVSVDAISVDSSGTTTVLGAGKTIQHTQCHLDPGAFREAVSRRSGKPIYGAVL
jgi:drug/metabolite transporter superfamily protein YnfA